MLGRHAPDVGPRLTLDLAELREIRKLSRRSRHSAGADGARRADAAQDAARLFLDVFLRDAPFGPVPSTSLMLTPISRARRLTAGDAGAARPSGLAGEGGAVAGAGADSCVCRTGIGTTLDDEEA
jgi:hypothetical protein